MTTQVVPHAAELPCVIWESENGNPNRLKPMKGTWTRAPALLRQSNIKGVLSCPRCGHAALLTRDSGELGDNPANQVLPAFGCRGCGLVARVTLAGWNRWKLFCAAWETFEGGRVTPHKEYFDAEDVADARKQWEMGHVGESVHLVGIAPVIGYRVLDSKGKKLAV